MAGRVGAEDVKEICMRPRSPHCLSAALAVCVLLPAAARAQVIPFAGNFGQGLAPSDNQMVFESAARLNAVEPSKVGQSDSWSNPETKSSGTSTILRVFHPWLATWCAIKLSQEGHRLATTASPGAVRRPENGRSRADRPNVAPPPSCGRAQRLASVTGPKTAR